MAEDYETARETVLSFAASYKAAIDAQDSTKLSATLTPDCMRTVEPESFARNAGVTPMTVKDYENRILSEYQVMKDMDMKNIQKLVIDTKARSVSARISGDVTWKDGRTDVLEFVFMLDLTDDFRKIKAIAQFIDTAKAQDVLANIQASLAVRQ
jgi:hypothetical protein